MSKRHLLAALAALPLGAARSSDGPASAVGGPHAVLVGLFTALGQISIPPEAEILQTSGFMIPGKGGARYRRSAPLPEWGRGKWWNADATGAHWVLAEDQPETDMFGTLGDAVMRAPSAGGPIASSAALLATTSGTDVTARIQDCVDFCLYKGIKFATLSEGRHLVSGPVHLGYGQTFASVSLMGRGSCYAPWDPQFGGSVVIATHSDAPVFVFQGARDAALENLTVCGLFANWVAANHLAANSQQAVRLDDTEIVTWTSPALSPTQDTRYTPFAAVAVDPYSGSRPAVSYPDVNYPAWTGIAQQYQKRTSSGITIRDVTIMGVIAAVAIQPCDADANGDFVQLDRVSVSYSKYMLSAGNAQGRSVGLHACTYNSVHTLFEGRTHGRQVGRFQGAIDNLSGSSCIQVLNVDAGYALPMSFRNCYFEGTWRIGNAVGSNSASLVFSGTYFHFVMPVQDNSRGQPTNHLSGSPTRHIGVSTCQAPVRFIGCKIVVESVFMVMAQDLSFDGEIRPVERDSGTLEPYAAYAHNALAGGIVVFDFADAPNSGVNLSIRYKQADGITGAIGGDVSMMDNRFKCSRIARRYGVPIYASSLEPAAAGTAVAVRQKPSQRPKSSFSHPSRSGRAMTLTDTSEDSPGSIGRTGRLPGDVWLDRDTGTVFFVSSYNPQTKLITLQQQNNWKGKAGDETATQSLALTRGEWECMPTRLYTPDYPLLVDSKTGSPILTNAGTADGNSAGLANGSTAVGDSFTIDNYEDNLVSQDGTTISAMDTAAKTITMSASANETQTRKRLAAFRAAPPANVRAP